MIAVYLASIPVLHGGIPGWVLASVGGVLMFVYSTTRLQPLTVRQRWIVAAVLLAVALSASGYAAAMLNPCGRLTSADLDWWLAGCWY